jgi:hypothetical protein
MSIRPFVLAIAIGAAACVIPPQPQSTGAPKQPGGAPAATTATVTPSCAAIFECYASCQTLDEACVTTCETGADPTTVANTRALAACVLDHQCADAACMQTTCSVELTACSATGAGHAIAPSVATGGMHAVAYVGIGFYTGGLDSYGSHTIAYRILLDDGTVFRRIPDTGLAGIDDAVRLQLGDMAGTYVWNGDTLEMQFGTYRESLTRGADGALTGSAGTFTPADPLDGAVLDGFYSVRESSSGFTFAADGRFRSDRDSWLMLRDRSGNEVVIPDGTGAYQIASNTLTLVYDDTRQVIELPIVTLYPADLPHPAGILIGTWQYTRT